MKFHKFPKVLLARPTATIWSSKRGSSFAEENWVESTARRLELETALRPRGRHSKQKRSGKGEKES